MVSLKSYGLLLLSWLRWIDHYLLGQIGNPLICPRAPVPRAYTINPWFPAKFGEGKRHHGVGLGAYCGIGSHRKGSTYHVKLPKNVVCYDKNIH
jgi:hypothetical protein